MKTGAFFDILVHPTEDSPQAGIFGLFFQDLEHADHGHPGVEHGFELFGKKDQFRRLDRRQQFPDFRHLKTANGRLLGFYLGGDVAPGCQQAVCSFQRIGFDLTAGGGAGFGNRLVQICWHNILVKRFLLRQRLRR